MADTLTADKVINDLVLCLETALDTVNGYPQMVALCRVSLVRAARWQEQQTPTYAEFQVIASEVIAMFDDAGYGKPGTANTLWAMTRAACAEVKELRAKVASYQEQQQGRPAGVFPVKEVPPFTIETPDNEAARKCDRCGGSRTEPRWGDAYGQPCIACNGTGKAPPPAATPTSRAVGNLMYEDFPTAAEMRRIAAPIMTTAELEASKAAASTAAERAKELVAEISSFWNPGSDRCKRLAVELISNAFTAEHFARQAAEERLADLEAATTAAEWTYAESESHPGKWIVRQDGDYLCTTDDRTLAAEIAAEHSARLAAEREVERLTRERDLLRGELAAAKPCPEAG